MAFNSLMTRNNRSVSDSVRLEVGSSMTDKARVERQSFNNLDQLPLRKRELPPQAYRAFEIHPQAMQVTAARVHFNAALSMRRRKPP